MKRATHILTCLAMLSGGGLAAASEAETWANAGGSRRGNGQAEASARYEGDVGFARTQTRSGRVNTARGLAVGVDENGLSLSASNAVSLPNGQAVARNFNLSIGRNGEVAVSGGNSVSFGRQQRSAQAGGSTTAGPRRTVATSTAAGRSDRRGFSRATTHSRHSGGRRVIVRKARPFRRR